MKFIDSLKSQVIDGYSEKHHIIPRSMGGTDNRSNLIALTPRQHFVAHWMLWKAYGGSMGRAFFMMSNFGKYGKVNSRTYAMARADYAEQVSIQMTGKTMPPISEETRQKMSQSAIGRKVSDETKAKISAFNKGKKRDAEFCRKVSEGLKGKATRGTGWNQSEETRNKIGQAQVGALNHMHGRKHSMETRIKMAEAHKRRANFKKDLANGAELQDAEGNVIDGIAYLEELA
jgi:hypothetical protein